MKDTSQPSIHLETIPCIMHDVPTFKVTWFAPLLNVVQKEFLGDLWLDTELGCQAICDFVHDITKGTHLLQSHKFVLWVCNKLSLD